MGGRGLLGVAGLEDCHRWPRADRAGQAPAVEFLAGRSVSVGQSQGLADVGGRGGGLYLAHRLLGQSGAGGRGDAGGELPLHQRVDAVWQRDWPLAAIAPCAADVQWGDGCFVIAVAVPFAGRRGAQIHVSRRVFRRRQTACHGCAASTPARPQSGPGPNTRAGGTRCRPAW